MQSRQNFHRAFLSELHEQSDFIFRGRGQFCGPFALRTGRVCGRGRLQHGDDGLSGGFDRSFLRRTDRHDDVPAHRQLRCEQGRRRVGEGPRQGVCRQGILPRALQLPRDAKSYRLLRREQDHRGRGC